MGIILGYLCLVCLLLILAKFIARKSGNKSLNRFFYKIHKPASCIFLIACVIHLILAVPVLKTRDCMVNFTGFLAFILAIVLIILCHTIKNAKQKMWIHRLASFVLLVIALVHVVIYFIDFRQYQNCISEITIENMDLTQIKDGAYVGAYDAGYIYAKVKVTIEDGRITQIELLEHKNERGQRAEEIVDKIVTEQRLNVDSVSGATNSSLVIKKACEDALTNQ